MFHENKRQSQNSDREKMHEENRQIDSFFLPKHHDAYKQNERNRMANILVEKIHAST